MHSIHSRPALIFVSGRSNLNFHIEGLILSKGQRDNFIYSMQSKQEHSHLDLNTDSPRLIREASPLQITLFHLRKEDKWTMEIL